MTLHTVFHYRDSVGSKDNFVVIPFNRQVLAHVRTIPELILLGSTSQNVKRLPIFSFMVRHPRGTFLHHNFVCAVLNDVFGIQARSGCACVGRYAHNLMGIDAELAKEYENLLAQR